MKNKIIILLLLYPVGLFLALLFILFRFLGKIRIVHPERFPRGQGKIIISSNHPSLLEPVLLPVMCYPEYLRHPFKRIPISTPDKNNYFNPLYWRWLLKRTAVPIDRGNRKENIKALRKLVRILNELNGIVVIFGVSSLIKITNPLVLSVWVEIEKKTSRDLSDKMYFNSLIFVFFTLLWRGITIKIGQPVKFEGARGEITQKLLIDLLELADEE